MGATGRDKQVTAMEMSCLTSVDEDDKDADPKTNPLTVLQEPMRMAQESTSCTDSFAKASSKQNTVLHVLSNTDMLSPVGLGNGPSLHQATQAHEMNSISEKEEEKSITPLKTVQEIDTTGIWGFDVESPENSLDNFDSASDLNWDPHKEFMQFLWENHSDSPGEEPKEEVSINKSQRRRKRKMDMVVMVDPSENLCPDLSSTSSEDSSDAEGQVDSSPVRKVRKSQKLSKPQSPPTGKASKYPNGTAKAIKDILLKAPARNSQENSVSHGISPLKGKLTMNSQSAGKSSYPCPKCNLIFKKQHRLHHHMKSHVDLPSISPKPFTCRECGQSFKHSGGLIDHMSVHQEKKSRLVEEIKGMNDKKKQDKNAKFFCPQCPFGTDCPNTFVQHAKTHEKDKKYSCDKCNFRTLSENDLRRHNIMQHTVITVRKQIQSDATETFPCNICSYKAFGKHVFENHLLRRHQLSFEEYTSAQKSENDAQPSKEPQVPTFKAPVHHRQFTSKISIKDQISSKQTCSPDEPSDISDLFKNSKFKRAPKSQLAESKLDKSINVLLSRQNHGKKSPEEKRASNNCSTNAQGSEGDMDDWDDFPKTLSIKVEDSPESRNGPKLSADHPSAKKSQSKRKMSTPYRNTSDQDTCFILPKPLPSPKKVGLDEVDCDETDIFQLRDSDGDGSIKKEKKNVIYTYSRRMSIRGALQASKRLFEKIKNEEQEQNDPEIKEECIETEVFQETFESHQIPLGESLTDDLAELESGHKTCPYCPAVFESGVGLSNHIRGHLHRVGLSYNARHVVPPEQVASQDRRPRIRRKMSAFRRLKKAFQSESDPETVKGVHSCPLCGDSFDNRTGQSNHIRGHLKKLGKSCPTKNKSPLILLRELMRDKRECQRALQILGRRRNHFYYGASPKLPAATRFPPSQTGFPKGPSVPGVCSDAKPLMPTFSIAEAGSEKGALDVTGTTALIGILKKRKCQEDARAKAPSQLARNVVTLSTNGENIPRVASSLPNSGSEKGEFNRKVCIHCNATFHSGVSLSNHLRAYAKRKRIALLEGTTIDCKAVRTRSRPGSKKKTLPLTQTPEQMYRLTCRFCDLVFQGPLSVQEDWIKHLQRHIMNTGVPHTGLGMVEVPPVPSDPPSLTADPESSSTVTHAAS